MVRSANIHATTVILNQGSSDPPEILTRLSLLTLPHVRTGKFHETAETHMSHVEQKAHVFYGYMAYLKLTRFMNLQELLPLQSVSLEAERCCFLDIPLEYW